MVSFDLTPTQKATREAIQSFAVTHLGPARAVYESESASLPVARFKSLLPIYKQAVGFNLIKALVPIPLGGTGGTLLDSALVTEEFYAVDTSSSLTILGTGLGLTPLFLAGSPAQFEKFLGPFLSGEGAPLASFVFSEPGGSANYVEKGGKGLATVAVLEGEEYVLNGEKIWATNCGGWDDRGAELMCVVCRVVDSEYNDENSSKGKSPDQAEKETAILIVTREDIAANEKQAFAVLEHPRTLGHTAVNGPHIKFTNLRVPRGNLLAKPGQGAAIAEQTFTGSAALVAAMGVGIMRQTFERALAWAKTEKRGGEEYVIEKQSVADLLIKIKIRCEAARMMCWKACDALDKGQGAGGQEAAYEAKIIGSENAVESVLDAINLMGVSAYSHKEPLAALLNDAVVLPIFDGGNIGVRRRQIEAIFKRPDYQPWEATFGVESKVSVRNGVK